jgi:hypothetical protein
VTDALSVLETVLSDGGYRTSRAPDREGVLGESASRVVWAVSFAAVLDLLEGWEQEQDWLIALARDHLTVEKAWELYLVLGCDPDPDPIERHALEAVRRDSSYARKLVVPSLAKLSLAGAKDWLAPLEELRLPQASTPPDALGLVEETAVARGNEDALKVIAAYRSNRPLFEEL